MNSNLLIALVCFLCPLFIYGQGGNGGIYLNSGKEITSDFVKRPIAGAKNVHYKANKGHGYEKVKSNTVDSLYLADSADSFATYIYIEAKESSKSDKVDAYLAERVIEGPVTLYRAWMPFKIGSPEQQDHYVYVAKRDNEEMGSVIGFERTGHMLQFADKKAFCSRAGAYFNDCEKLSADLLGKKYGVGDIFDVIELYNEWARSSK